MSQFSFLKKSITLFVGSVIIGMSHQVVQASSSYAVGEKEEVYKDTKRNRELKVHVWYPVAPAQPMKPEIKSGPFIPVFSAKNAAFAKAPAGGFPVVLLSHGSGGKANKLFWLTDRLVRAGAVVIAVDHPGNMTGDNSADGLARVWERSRDLSLALDRMASSPDIIPHLNLKKVTAVGHSIGGTTVLLLAGGRLEHSRFTSPIPKCSGTNDPFYAILCAETDKTNFKTYDKTLVEGDYSDSRVRAVVALDPGMARSFNPESLKSLKSRPLVMIADRLNAPQDEIYGRDFLTLMPSGSAKVIPQTYHMTFLQACKPGFPAKDPELAELCVENEKKLGIQRAVASEIVSFFQDIWTSTP